jgi:hypothetical protein
MATYAENIVECFYRATDSEYAEGMSWYNDTHDIALSLTPDNVWRGAGVIAAFSPQQNWEQNLAFATRACKTGIATGHTTMMCGQAQRILDGEHPLDVLGGMKVRAFAAAIATNGQSDIATIDRHAHDIAMGRVFTQKERKIGKRLFRVMSEHYRQAAMEIGIATAQMQATTWVVWRNEKG